MIKPDAVENGHIGPILEKIASAGFKIIAMKFTQMSRRDAEQFYTIHKDRPFFGELVEFMTRGPIVAAILEKENAVEDFRALIGATNPAEFFAVSTETFFELPREMRREMPDWFEVLAEFYRVDPSQWEWT